MASLIDRGCSMLRSSTVFFRRLCSDRTDQLIPKDENWVGLLTDDQRKENVSERTLYLVSEHIGFGFENLGMKLGLPYACVERCISSKTSSQLQILAMLDTWRKRNGKRASVEKLLIALQDSISVCNIDMFEILQVLQTI